MVRSEGESRNSRLELRGHVAELFGGLLGVIGALGRVPGGVGNARDVLDDIADTLCSLEHAAADLVGGPETAGSDMARDIAAGKISPIRRLFGILKIMSCTKTTGRWPEGKSHR